MNSSFKFLLFLFICKIVVSVEPVLGQSYPCYLYGNIVTVDGDVYTGAIRWDDEEVFLSDMFNSEKEENSYLKYLPDSHKYKAEKKYEKKSNWASINVTFGDDRSATRGYYARKFQCRFGDIKSISVTGRESVSVELRDKKYINLTGGSNDVGAQVRVLDKELGLLKIDWNRISEVVFTKPESDQVENFGEPIYGKLTTTKGEFSGFIQWDHDERLLSDKLDGRGKDGEVSIPFEKIKQIEKTANGSRITLNSDREFELRSQNDVNSNNRGIIVSIPNVGRVDFPWSHFLSLEILPLSKEKAKCLSEFRVSERLFGTIVTRTGESHTGVIVYDLDEAMDSEILNGLNDKLKFSIPFRNVKSITPKAHNYCLVELKNGENLYLGDQTDVSNKNAGIIIFVKQNQFEVFKWENIKRIDFM